MGEESTATVDWAADAREGAQASRPARPSVTALAAGTSDLSLEGIPHVLPPVVLGVQYDL